MERGCYAANVAENVDRTSPAAEQETLVGDLTFDRLARRVAAASSRRTVLRLISGAVFGTAATARTPLAAANHFTLTPSGKHRHWDAVASVAQVVVNDSLTPEWAGQLRVAAADWSVSPHIELNVVDSDDSPPLRELCGLPGAAAPGQIRVCNFDYGATGFVGRTDSISSSSTGHIVWANCRLNERYLNSPAALPHRLEIGLRTLCHELGHAIGLGHQIAAGTESGISCMSAGAETTLAERVLPEYQHPNLSDLAMLGLMYGHDDTPPAPPLPPKKKKKKKKRGKKRRGKRRSAPVGAADVEASRFREELPEIKERIARLDIESWIASRRGMDTGDSAIAQDLGNGYTLTVHITWADQELP
jgi:hypothetical protein